MNNEKDQRADFKGRDDMQKFEGKLNLNERAVGSREAGTVESTARAVEGKQSALDSHDIVMEASLDSRSPHHSAKLPKTISDSLPSTTICPSPPHSR